MKTTYWQLIVLTALLIPNFIWAQKHVFPAGIKAPNVHHTGEVWLNHLFDANENFDFNIAQAVSAKGSKLNWHYHPKGQLLLITHGVGFYQEKDKEVRMVKAGDVVECLPNVEHWHGATPGSPVTYLAISGNAATKWTDTLTAETYNALPLDLPLEISREEILELSKRKWQWMADKQTDKLAELFHKDAEFVHMGGSWGKDREIEIIRDGSIHYKKADVHEASVSITDNTAIVLNRISLLAVVGGNEVTNPFIVTEVYIKVFDNWKLANLSFVKQLSADSEK